MEISRIEFLEFISEKVKKAEKRFLEMQNRYYYNSSDDNDELGGYKIDTAYNYYLGMQHLKDDIINFLNRKDLEVF